MKKVEILMLSFLLLIFIFIFNYMFEDKVLESVNVFFEKTSYPFFLLRKGLNTLFDDDVKYKMVYFGIEKDELVPLSFSEKGIYFFGVDATGVILTNDKRLFGIVNTTGNFVFVKKWWYDKFEVTVVTDKFEIEALLDNGNLEFFDSVEVKNGNIYYSKYLPYGVYLHNLGVRLGYIKDGKVYLNLTNFNLNTHFFLLEDYIRRR
ncbi:hypothetical protein XJ44_07135 [Thermosipho affectus]|uniref:Uncharacterized protein n=1 Tax=Thermosipho affectus TaxID=660294 RepID=A0ABX3IFQ5_9BACT|nr:hypothetical protein [Thermosipho affectus]ONN26643.1 hypothetical protein XJ44_07135 [Thermosipho affectus]